MRCTLTALGVLVVVALASPALAGITVTEYRTLALTNAFAPTSQTQYYAEQTLVNVSPALAEVSGDWMGTNAGGSTPTWHFVGMSRSTSITTFDASSLTVTGAGSFSYEINTTSEFIDPRSSTILTPGGAGNYNGFFNTDVSTTYTMSARLNRRGRVRLNSLDGTVVFDETNVSAIPVTVDLSGMIPPGQYRVLISASLAAPNLPNGINHFEASGSYDDVIFTVQVPEPADLTVGFVITMIVQTRRRKRCL